MNTHSPITTHDVCFSLKELDLYLKIYIRKFKFSYGLEKKNTKRTWKESVENDVSLHEFESKTIFVVVEL